MTWNRLLEREPSNVFMSRASSFIPLPPRRYQDRTNQPHLCYPVLCPLEIPKRRVEDQAVRATGEDGEPIMVNIDTTRSYWRSRGFSCDIWTDPPGQTWEDYTHAVDELVMVLEGDVEFEFSGKVLRPPIGDELFIPAGVLHSVRNRGKTTSRWLYGYKMNQS